ncbi:hypothetical protein [Butyrivibrio sp. AE2032]|uniref:hypothetical protein n=1 Tax=Butyrivibrio sp. AE2032 TaxID=1458463 RepID=UPI000558D4BA|nr:hypothetical protein [Butyrivibrio sp. AE2032]
MLRFKLEKTFLLFKKTYKNLSTVTYDDIVEFSEENGLSYGIARFDEIKDTLYIKTNEDECFIASNGEPEKCTGKYIYLASTEDYEGINQALNDDLKDIICGNRDIVCVNNPILLEE